MEVKTPVKSITSLTVTHELPESLSAHLRKIAACDRMEYKFHQLEKALNEIIEIACEDTNFPRLRIQQMMQVARDALEECDG